MKRIPSNFDIAEFLDAKFNDSVNFEYAKFNIVGFSNSTFHKTIYLHGTDYEDMQINWSSLENSLTFDGEAYNKLIKNFREREQFKDADNAYYNYRFLSQKNKKGFSWLIDETTLLMCGYGVRPFNAIICGGIIILLFSIFYWHRNGISRLNDNNGSDNQNVSFGDALYFSMVTFTTLGYGDFYPNKHARKMVMIESLLGWLILALFIVTLANVMLRP